MPTEAFCCVRQNKQRCKQRLCKACLPGDNICITSGPAPHAAVQRWQLVTASCGDDRLSSCLAAGLPDHRRCAGSCGCFGLHSCQLAEVRIPSCSARLYTWCYISCMRCCPNVCHPHQQKSQCLYAICYPRVLWMSVICINSLLYTCKM